MNFIDITGQRFGNLLVIERAYTQNKHIKWLCKCDCGNTTFSDSYQLRNGITSSCGCLKDKKLRESRYKHGFSGKRLYRIYNKMKERCYRPDNDNYKWYGGRGIKVCDEWLGENGSTNFCEWAMANGYNDTLTLDRLDNDKDYSSKNCRWATWKEQQNNRRNSKNRKEQ